MFSSTKLVGLFTSIVVALSLGGCASTESAARAPVHHASVGGSYVMASDRTANAYTPAAIPAASSAGNGALNGSLNVAQRNGTSR